MKQVSHERYLGCYLSNSVADSAATTVAKRIGIVSRIIYDARTVVEDRRAGAVGGITLAFQIWESVCVPMLLYGLEVFNVIPKKTMKALDNIALKQIRVTMGIGKQGYVIPCLLFECGIPPMCDRILYYRLLFFFHLSSLEEDSLAGRL